MSGDGGLLAVTSGRPRQAASEHHNLNANPNRYIVEFDRERDAYIIDEPGRDPDLQPAIVIRRETLEAMSPKEAWQFIGTRLIAFTPELKEMFKDCLWTDGGHTPPKLV